MSVFSNYNPQKAGGVLQQAKPAVAVYPWVPNKQTSPGTFNRLVTPTERGNWFLRQPGATPKGPNGNCGCNHAALNGGKK